MTNPPRISVLMTVFNAGSFLPAAVESILSQTFTDFEFIIVDDASTDGSVERLRAFAERDARVRLLCNESNQGQTASLNLGLQAARADWVARQDADDLSLPGRLAEHIRLIDKAAGIVLTGVNGWIIDENDRVTGMIHAPLGDAGIRWSMPFRNPFIHAGVAFRRLQPDGAPVQYDERFRICQDWELWSRLLAFGSAENSPDCLVAYRHRAGSLSHLSVERTREESDQIVREIWSRHRPNRPLADSEMALLRSFRDGLAPADRREFWKFYRESPDELGGGKDRRQAEAVHRLQAAGALAAGAPLAAIADGLAGFFAAPAWMIQTIVRRVIGPTIGPSGR